MMTKKRYIILIAVMLAVIGVILLVTIKPESPVITSNNIIDTGKNRITWEEAKRASYYQVYRSKSENGEYVLVKSTSELSYIDEDTVAGEIYYYYVKSVCATKTVSHESNIIKLICKLSRPEVTVSNVEETGKIKVEWTASDGAEEYEVYRAESETDEYKLIKTTTETSMTNTSVKVGNRYFYKVRSIDSNPSANSEYSVVKDGVCILSQPQLFMPKINAECNIRLTWESVRGAVGYEIYRSENKESDYISIGSVKGEKFVDKTAVEGVFYYYKVCAVAGDSIANSAYSVIKDIKLIRSEGITVGVMFGEERVPSFVWNGVYGTASYKVYRSFYSDKGFSLLSTRAIRRYTNQTFPEGLTLYYKIVATDGRGRTQATSKIIYVTIPLKEKENLKTCYLKQYMTNIYSLPVSDSVSTRVRYMEKLELGKAVVSRPGGEWYRVFYNDELYYLWSEDIEASLTDKKSTFKYKGKTKYQQEVVDLAVDIAQNWKTIFVHSDKLGVPDSNGVYSFDCSGFVKYVFNTVMQKYNPAYGISADVQKLYATTGVCNKGYKGEFNAIDVDIDELQPGDILFFKSFIRGDSSETIKHIAIYLGNNEFAHSTSAWDDSVCIISLTGHYLENFVGARRYLPESVTPANAEAVVKGPFKKHRVYEEKSAYAPVIKKLRNGEKVTVIFTDSEKWAYIETKSGVKGYIFLDYLA